jgi:hypothetical protein
MHKVQTPNRNGLDPILRARSGDEPVRREGSIGVTGKNNNIGSSNNILNIKSDSSLESIGIIDGFQNESTIANNTPIIDDSVRTPTARVKGNTSFDDNATTTSEKRKVRWGPSTKAPQNGCSINSSGSMQLADLYQGIVDISSTLGKSAQQLGEKMEVMGMACVNEGHVLRGECANAFDAACGDNCSSGKAGGCHYSKEEDNSLIYSSNHYGMAELFQRDTAPEARDGIKESRDALDSYDHMRESRESFKDHGYALNDGNPLITEGNHVSMPSNHFTFNQYDGDGTNQNYYVTRSSRVDRQKAQRSYFYSPTLNRSPMNNIETGMGVKVNMMSPTYHRSPRTFGIDSPYNNAMKPPVSILKKNQSRYVSTGAMFPSTTGDVRVKLRTSPRNSSFPGKPPTRTSLTASASPSREKKKKNTSRRVLGGLVKKSLKFISHGTKSQLKNARPTPNLAIDSSPSQRRSR